MAMTRSRTDQCPGTFRPWRADDGLLIRLRLIGGRLPVASLSTLLQAAEDFGDGAVYLTSRANVQVRGFRSDTGTLLPEQQAAIERTGLVPSPMHDLVRNVMVSPLTGYGGGRADLRAVCVELDRLICADADLADLPGRFLFVLDDGRGDLIDRSCDLGLIALDSTRAQLRVGTSYGDVVELTQAAQRLYELARLFQQRRGGGPSAPWHVTELDRPMVAAQQLQFPADRWTAPLEYGPVEIDAKVLGHHWAVPENGLDRAYYAELVDTATEVVVTPWRGIFVPREHHV